MGRVGAALSHSWLGTLDPPARLNEFTPSSVFQHSTLKTICCAHSTTRPLVQASAPDSQDTPRCSIILLSFSSSSGSLTWSLCFQTPGWWIESVQSFCCIGHSIRPLLHPSLSDDLCSPSPVLSFRQMQLSASSSSLGK